MNLYKKQLEIQKDSIVLIDEFSKKNKSLSKFISKLSKRINEYKKKHFFEIANKIVTKENFFDIFKEDANYFYEKLAKKFANEFIDYVDSNDFLQKIYKDDIDYRIYEKGFEKFNNIIFEDFFKILNSNLLKEKQQFASFYISIIPSGEVAKALVKFLLFLEEEKITRQDAGDKFFNITENVIEKIIKKRLSNNILFDVGEELENIEQKNKQLISQELIDLISDYLDEERNEKGAYLIFANSKFKREIKLDNFLLRSVIKYKPMVCPPRDWSSLDNGGFLEGEEIDKRFKLLFIKTHTPIERKFVKKYAKIPNEIFSAVNRLQKVGYKINKDMIEVLDYFYKQIPKEFKKYPKSAKIILENLENINTKLELVEFISKGVIETFKDEVRKKSRYKLNEEKIKETYAEFVKRLFKYKDLKFRDILLELAKLDDFLKPFRVLVDEYKNYDEFFYVWLADFRGRLYTAQSVLQPQGSDLVKSFLLFSQSQKLNENGVKWFKIHGANLYGEVDKAPYEDRIRWVEENEDKILSSVNFKEETFWQEADEPFEFLAFCFEYKRYKENPNNFETSIPVAIDGSNNGIQHISTFMQDINAAKKVNVLPTEKVEDIYKEVAKTFKKLLEEDFEEFKRENKDLVEVNGYKIAFKIEEKEVILIENLFNEWIEFLEKHSFEELIKNLTTKTFNKKYKITVEEQKKSLKELKSISDKIGFGLVDILKQKLSTLTAEKNKKGLFVIKEKKEVLDSRSLIPYILDKVDRSFVKKPVMIDSYGAGIASKSDKFKEMLEEILNLDEDYIFRFATYLASKVDKAINIEITCSDVYQQFMKNIISKYFEKNKNAKFFSYETPLGFRVLQMEFKTTNTYIKLDKYKIKVSLITDAINLKEHKNGIAPNYVHSLDATHLYMTLNRFDKPIRVIHDSYATLPNDVDELFNILKEEFVKLYSKDVFREFVFSVLDKDSIEEIVSKKKIFSKYAVDLIPKIDKEFPLKDILKSKYMFS